MFFRKKEKTLSDIKFEIINYCQELDNASWKNLQGEIEAWRKHYKAVEKADAELEKDLAKIMPSDEIDEISKEIDEMEVK